MVEIELIEQYYLRGDSKQWILSEKKINKKTSEPYFYDLGYYRDIKVLLRDLLGLSVRLKGGKTLDELILYTTQTKKALKKLLESFSEFNGWVGQ